MVQPRRMIRFLVAALALCVGPTFAAASHEDQLHCHEFPVVVVTAKSSEFPDPTCNQLRFPAEDCLKKQVLSTIEVVDHQDGTPNCFHSPRTSTYEAKTGYRGQTSLFFPKHQIGVKFMNATEFIGFPEDRDFVLNGPFADCSLMRNHLAHWLYRGTGRYSPRTKHVAMYFSATPGQAPTYVGIYLLIEKLGYGKHRVGLANMDPSCRGNELNGGWAWHQDPAGYGDYSPNMVIDQYQNQFGMGERPILAYPTGDATSQLMRNHFVNTTTGFLPQLYRFLWNNMTNPDGLEDHIDLGSFADYILHTEMSLNVDAYRRSTYFFKDRDQTINAGPVWDLNLAYGNGARRHFDDWIYPQYTYWKRLMCNYKLTSLMIQRWTRLRDPHGGVWSDASIVAFLDVSAEPVRRQLTKCTGDWRTNVAQCAAVDLKTCNGTYEETLTELKTAVLHRARWMDEHITSLYKRLDGSICSPVGDLPLYNCAADGNDDGCLSDPAKYYNGVAFPPIRKPYSGPECGSGNIKEATQHYKTEANLAAATQPSVDHCWLSTGVKAIYPHEKGVRDSRLTPFCGGYGTCQQGPGATCTCVEGIRLDPASCRRIDAETSMQKEVMATERTGSVVSRRRAITSVVLGVGILAALALVTLKARAYRTQRLEGLNVYRPVRYGSMEHKRYFSQPSGEPAWL